MSWQNFSNKPLITTDEGIKAKKALTNKNWWAQQWLAAMEALVDRGRLQRGRRYARKGQVTALIEKKGEIEAKVQGTRKQPYKIRIGLTHFSDKEWETILALLQSEPIFLAQLLNREMPPDIDTLLAQEKLELFPQKSSAIEMSCSCPDWADVCKHLAAVHYILAERFDEDPFLLFRLRGRSEQYLLDNLKQQQEERHEEAEVLISLDEEIDHFWEWSDSLDNFSIDMKKPEIPHIILERLGKPSFLSDRSWGELAEIYTAVSDQIYRHTFGENDEVS